MMRTKLSSNWVHAYDENFFHDMHLVLSVILLTFSFIFVLGPEPNHEIETRPQYARGRGYTTEGKCST